MPDGQPAGELCVSAPRPPVRKSPPPDPDRRRPILRCLRRCGDFRLSVRRLRHDPPPPDRSDANLLHQRSRSVRSVKLSDGRHGCSTKTLPAFGSKGKSRDSSATRCRATAYLALKDTGARVEAMLRRQVAQSLSFPLRDGLKVRVRGRLTIYRNRALSALHRRVVLSGKASFFCSLRS